MALRTAFATDFDGTLYFHHEGDFGSMGPEGYRSQDVKAIRAYQAAGGLFGICTGRSLGMLEMQYYDMIHPDFVIANTGACIYDGHRNPLWERTCPVETLCEVHDLYAQQTRMTIFIAGDDFYLLHGEMDFPMKRIACVEELPGPCFGMSLEFERGQDELAARIAGEINGAYGAELAAYQNLASVDIVAAGCSKGSGVRRVRQELGVDLIASMGDSFNDLSMLEATDVSYTFPYAPAEVREAADVLVGGIDEALADLQAR